MSQNLTRAVLGTLSVLILLSCKSPLPVESDGVTNPIYGDWLWYKTSGGIGGSVYTPDPGIRTVMSLVSDGSYLVHVNDTLRHAARFTLTRGFSIYSRDSADVLTVLDSSRTTSWIVVHLSDTLMLGDNLVDGWEMCYARVRR